MKILCEGKCIRLRMESTEKNSVLITGGSRMGKTFFASNFARQLMEEGHTVHLIDLGEKWSRQNKERLSSAGAITNEVSKQGMELAFGSETELYGCAKVIANVLGFRSPAAEAVLAECLQIKPNAKETGVSIKNVTACLNTWDTTDAEKQGWAAKISMRLREWTAIPDIRFCMGQGRGNFEKSAIWDFSGLGSAYIELAAYLLVYCLYCQQKREFKNGSRMNKTYVIIDEFQNLDCDRKSIIGTCLAEGQKYGLLLVLITQFLKGNFWDAVLNQFKQGGYRFYFRLTEEEAAIVSRQLSCNPQVQIELRRKLAAMPRGNCLMMGLHSVGNRKEVTEVFRFVEIQEDVHSHKKVRSNILHEGGLHRGRVYAPRGMEV